MKNPFNISFVVELSCDISLSSNGVYTGGVFYALRTVKAKSELMKYVNRLKPIKSVIHFDMQIIYMLHTPYV